MKKYSAVFLALVFALLTFAGCADKETPEAPETTASETTAEAETVTVQDYQPSATEESQPAGDIAENTGDGTTTANALPETIPEIVELFNKSANRIKPEAKKVVKNFEKRIVNEEKLVIPKGLESTANTMMNTFMGDDTEPIVYTTKDEIKNEFLVPNQSYVSKLKATDVESATVTDKGNEYVITIKLKDEKNPVPGKGIGSVCDVIETSEVSEKASFIKDFSTEYYDCEVKMTVDKATGRVTHAEYKTPLLLKVTVDLFGTHNGVLGFTFIKDYSITY